MLPQSVTGLFATVDHAFGLLLRSQVLRAVAISQILVGSHLKFQIDSNVKRSMCVTIRKRFHVIIPNDNCNNRPTNDLNKAIPEIIDS